MLLCSARLPLVAVAGLLPAPMLFADTATLTWVNPTQNTDGTQLTQAIAQTNLRCSGLVVSGVRSPCALADQVSIGTGTTFFWTYTITSYMSGQICFIAQTQLVDTSISDWSNEACKAFAASRRSKSPTLTVK